MADPRPTDDPLAERAEQVEELRRFVDSTSFNGDERDNSGELSHADQHPADSSDVVEQRARDFTIRQMLDDDAAQIAEARRRQQEGTYGTCQECGRPIDAERLRARPEATTCVDCQRRREE